jgi:hypothetical protein
MQKNTSERPMRFSVILSLIGPKIAKYPHLRKTEIGIWKYCARIGMVFDSSMD